MTAQKDANKEWFSRAQRVIAGGVNSPVRAFAGVGGTPVTMQRGEGAKLWDVDSRCYVDYVCSWGAVIVGHAQPQITNAVAKAAENGLGFGAPTAAECCFAEKLCDAMPSLEMTRAVNSGTEATMSAIRLARGFAKRDILIKFDGCYHGHADSLLVAAGSGALTLAKPSCAGVTAAAAADTWVLPYNDAQAVRDVFARHGDDIAAVIVEPVAGNMNLVRGDAEFLNTLRQLTSHHGAVLIFDEVMSGFRVARGSAQAVYDIAPDLTCLGKVIGGGLPVAAFGGRRDIMKCLAPEGDVYQAGTLAGNPTALAAGNAALDVVLADGFFQSLSAAAEKTTAALTNAASAAGVTFCADFMGGMLGFYFRSAPPRNLTEVKECDIELFKKFFHAMLSRGVYLAPSAFEAGFITSAHGNDELAHTEKAARESFMEIVNS